MDQQWRYATVDSHQQNSQGLHPGNQKNPSENALYPKEKKKIHEHPKVIMNKLKSSLKQGWTLLLSFDYHNHH